MNLSLVLKYEKIQSLTYDSIFLEQPMADIVNFDYRLILPAPPKNIDKSTIKELTIVSKETLNRSSQDIETLLQIDLDIDPVFISLLKQYDIEYPEAYIKKFYAIVSPILKNVKGFWNRPRPKQLADLLGIDIDVIVTDTHHTPSYPSGHTVYSSLVANIIKDLYPKVNHYQLDKIVNDTAKARVMQGVHYPSDNKASILFTKFVFDKLHSVLKKDYYEKI